MGFAIHPTTRGLNRSCRLPYGLKPEHVLKAMCDYTTFLETVNAALVAKEMAPLEQFLMQANFSSMTGEFATARIPFYHTGVAKNTYHNGHPDIIPIDTFPNNSVQHSATGIEVKASRTTSWQGHNPEAIFLMVFCFDSNSPRDKETPRPFKFTGVFCGQLEVTDWTFSGRSATSRRTITATINASGVSKMRANWLYDSSREGPAGFGLT